MAPTARPKIVISASADKSGRSAALFAPKAVTLAKVQGHLVFEVTDELVAALAKRLGQGRIEQGQLRLLPIAADLKPDTRGAWRQELRRSVSVSAEAKAMISLRRQPIIGILTDNFERRGVLFPLSASRERHREVPDIAMND